MQAETEYYLEKRRDAIMTISVCIFDRPLSTPKTYQIDGVDYDAKDIEAMMMLIRYGILESPEMEEYISDPNSIEICAKWLIGTQFEFQLKGNEVVCLPGPDANFNLKLKKMDILPEHICEGVKLARW